MEYSISPAETTTKSTMIGITRINQAHEKTPPYLVLKFIIAIKGVFLQTQQFYVYINKLKTSFTYF